jgi:hypothetical protein
LRLLRLFAAIPSSRFLAAKSRKKTAKKDSDLRSQFLQTLPFAPSAPFCGHSFFKIFSRKESQKAAKKDPDLRFQFLRTLPFAPSAPFCGHSFFKIFSRKESQKAAKKTQI